MKAEERLADALSTLAQGVETSPDAPDAYDAAQATWQKRERRRRLVAAVLAVAVIAGADGAALWALSHGDSEAHLVEQPAP